MTITREQIEQATGHDLTDLVAEHVMGWQRRDANLLPWQNPNGRLMACPPAYALDIKAAWGVVEKLNATHYLRLGQEWLSGSSDGGVLGYEASFWRFKTYEGKDSVSVAETPALAICRAALKSLLPTE